MDRISGWPYWDRTLDLNMKTILCSLALMSASSFGADPSSQPLSDAAGGKKYIERARIVVDLDGDGEKDMLLSNPRTAGNSGLSWDVYLHRDGDYRQIGELWAHPKAISFEKVPGESHEGVLARVWVYHHGGAGAGSFGFYRVKKDSVDKLSALNIYPDNEGIGEKLYKATFDESPIPFEIEQSSTTGDGKVTWKKGGH